MSSKNTWLWMTVAVALFAFIFVFERYFQKPQPGPHYLLPNLITKTIQSVQIRRAGQSDIAVERTNDGWRLIDPISYPAQSAAVQKLLENLQQLTVIHDISEEEFRKDTNADTDYGVDPPQISLTLNSLPPVYFGRTTAPGDQVFVRIIGIGGVSVVDASVLNLFPPDVTAWRATALTDLEQMKIDRLTITNTAKSQSFQFDLNSTNKLWGITSPMIARADNKKVEDALQAIDRLRVHGFVSDDPKADLESFGLQPPALTVALGKGTNALLSLDFGKAVTNSPGMIYARRRDQNAVVTVSSKALAPWQTSYDTFRDRHLVSLTAPLDKITVQGLDIFSLQWHTNNTWEVEPQNFPADAGLSAKLAQALSDLQVADFEKDSVTDPDLPKYGLAPPCRKYILTWAATETGTNPPTELDFGTNSDGKIFARRLGEDAVYGIAPIDFERLYDASWQMHERQVWNFDAKDISRITIHQNGQTREIDQKGTNGWMLAGGAQGVINDSCVEATASDLGHLTAFWWVGHGARNLAQFGFSKEADQISIELKDGRKFEVQFAGTTRFGSPYAVVTLDNEPWIFEFPPDLFQHVRYCLSIPAAP